MLIQKSVRPLIGSAFLHAIVFSGTFLLSCILLPWSASLAVAGSLTHFLHPFITKYFEWEGLLTSKTFLTSFLPMFISFVTFLLGGIKVLLNALSYIWR